MAGPLTHPVQARMRAFQDLFNQLDQVTGTKAKVQALVDHFQEVDPGEAAWALTLLLGKRRRRLITGRRLRDILRDRGGLPDWLIDDCYGQVGDSAETISLLWPAVQERIEATDPGLPSGEGDMPLSWWMETLLPAISARSNDDQANAVIWLWHRIPLDQHFIVNKLLTGGSVSACRRD